MYTHLMPLKYKSIMVNLAYAFIYIFIVNLQSGGEDKNDLRSRGLCLVPVSSTANLTKEDGGMNRCGTGRQVTNRF